MILPASLAYLSVMLDIGQVATKSSLSRLPSLGGRRGCEMAEPGIYRCTVNLSLSRQKVTSKEAHRRSSVLVSTFCIYLVRLIRCFIYISITDHSYNKQMLKAGYLIRNDDNRWE